MVGLGQKVRLPQGGGLLEAHPHGRLPGSNGLSSNLARARDTVEQRLASRCLISRYLTPPVTEK